MMRLPVSLFLTTLVLAVVLIARPSTSAVPGIAVYPPLTLEAATNVDLRSRMVARLQNATGARVQALPFPSGLAPDGLIHGLAVNAKSNDFERFLVISTHPTGAAVIVDLGLYDSASEKRISAMSISAQAIGDPGDLDLAMLLPKDCSKDARRRSPLRAAPTPTSTASPAPGEHEHALATATVAAPATGAAVIVDPGATSPGADASKPGGLRGLVNRLHPTGDHTRRMNVILLPFEGKSGDPLGVHATLTFIQELSAIDVGVKVVKGVDSTTAIDDAICQTSQSDAIVTGTRASGVNGATTFGVALHACDPSKELPPPAYAQAMRQRFEDNVAHNPSTDPVVNAVRKLIRGMLAS